MVVDGSHGEDAFAVAQLVAAYLQHDGRGLHDEDAPDDDKEKLLRRADGSHAERSAQGQGAGVSHKYPGRVAIVPQEAQTGPYQGHHEDADFSRAGVEGNIQGISRQPASAEDGNDGVSNARGDGAAGGEAVQAVCQVHRIGGGHDHHDAERNINEPWQVHLAIERNEQGGYVVVKFHAGIAFRVQVQEGDAGQAGQELDEEFLRAEMPSEVFSPPSGNRPGIPAGPAPG